jgi:hypothetical protein
MANGSPVKVTVTNGTITIRFPVRLLKERLATKRQSARSKDWSILKTTRGMWRRRRLDGLEYQRRVRAEWDRCVPQ